MGEGQFNFDAYLPNLDRIYGHALKSLEDFTTKQTVDFRQSLVGLIGKEIVLRPTEAGTLEAELQGDYSGLVSLGEKKSKINVVAGAGYRTKLTRVSLVYS